MSKSIIITSTRKGVKMELKPLTGVLFQNDFAKTDKSPDVTGEINIEGAIYKIAGWKNVSSKGKKFMSLKLTFKEYPLENTPIHSPNNAKKETKNEVQIEDVF